MLRTLARCAVLLAGHAKRPRSGLRRGITLLSLVCAGCAVAAFGVAPIAPDAARLPVHDVEIALPVASIAQQVGQLESASSSYVHEEHVRRGDTLGTLLTRLEVDDPAAEAFIRSDPRARGLYQLMPGRAIQARTDEDGNLQWLRYAVPRQGDGHETASRAIVVERRTTGFVAREEAVDTDREIVLKSGQIRTSLFAATDTAGIPDAIATQLADVFSGDIDFYRDLRRGDRFHVIYEMVREGPDAGRPGRLLAAEFVNGGHVHQAVWYGHGGSGNYYGFDGQSLRRAFLRAPLQFTRISSGFGVRNHPLFHDWRQHTGVDYAAPIGTPVRTTGDGVVAFAGQQRGYGNVVIVQHQGGYSTVYGHLSRFASGIHAGSRVSQGDLIAYVGMTGWATGPHLHYEFRINGVAHDPLKVALPNAAPIARDQLALFSEQTRDLARDIKLLKAIDLASSAPSPAANG